MDIKKKWYIAICVLEISLTLLHNSQILSLIGILWGLWGYLGDMVAQTREVTGDLRGPDRPHKYLSGKMVRQIKSWYIE